jgi:hypothetical protein
VSIYENCEGWFDRSGFLGFYWVLIGLSFCCIVSSSLGSLFGSRETEENEDANIFPVLFFFRSFHLTVLFFFKLSLFGKGRRNEDAIWVINCVLEDF